MGVGVHDVGVMPAILLRPEWWDWAMFIIIPILLMLLVLAIWSICSGLAGILCVTRDTADQRRVPDIMAFLRRRRLGQSRRFIRDASDRPLLPR
jgi:hypothetical protein